MKRMLINVAEEEEARLAVVDGDLLSELYVEKTTEEKYLGNIYKGRESQRSPCEPQPSFEPLKTIA